MFKAMRKIIERRTMSKAMIDVDEMIRRQQRSRVQLLCCGEVFSEEAALGL